MKHNKSASTKGKTRRSALKRLAMLTMLVAACWLLSACYVDQDPVTDASNGLDLGDGGQTFENVITPTPTASPTPAATERNWEDWTFGEEEISTNPPSNVVTSTPSTGSSALSGLTTSGNVSTQTVVTNSPTPTPTPTPASSSSSATLKTGSSGSAVKQLQQRLKDLKYYTGSVDGVYGSGTEQAVRAFQAANGLNVDGKAGKYTQEKVYSASAVPASSTNTSSSSSSSSSNTSNSSTTTQNQYTNGETNIYLELGDTGAQVKYMQNRLIVLGYLTGTADGTFGETTQAAVIAFQERNSIYADGIAGPTTLSKLYSSSARKASAVVGNLGSLREGMNGDAVRALQRNLKSLGYYTGSVDGDYGSGTVAAVTAFQQAYGLNVDGIAGKATQNAIIAAVNGDTTPSGGGGTGGGSSSSTSPSVYGVKASSNGYSTLSASSGSSANITALQQNLEAQGYNCGGADGNYGTMTQNAVEAFQRARGLRVTGMAGPTTQRLLYGGTAESGSYSKLELGDSGSAVERLQYALYELKYYDGNITGKYDAATQSAVMVFQECNGLAIDGVAGQDTQRRLFSSAALPCNI